MRYDGIHAPVRAIPTDDETEPTDGRALCLSGGGFRAMLFHAGVLWRLNQAGRLPGLTRISSVSGGSITAGVLAAAWDRLDFDDRGVAGRFEELVATPLVDFAGRRVDVPAIVTGLLLPAVSGGERLAAALDEHLFLGRSLQHLPDAPRFIFNATNLETGSLVRFSKDKLADWQVGEVRDPDVPLSTAVACSSAFPPFLAPYVVDLSAQEWVTTPAARYTDRGFRDRMSLVDGGVYDNLGLETAWQKCRDIVVSDAGGRFGADPAPPGDWAHEVVRVLRVVDAQVRSLRSGQIRDALRDGTRTGMYLGIGCAVDDPALRTSIPVDPALAHDLARLPTRLTRMSARTRLRLVNWGYLVTDAWLSAATPDVPDAVSLAERLPYPAGSLRAEGDARLTAV